MWKKFMIPTYYGIQKLQRYRSIASASELVLSEKLGKCKSKSLKVNSIAVLLLLLV